MKVYTVVEIAKRLGRPRSTVVDWARQFEEYLPTEGTGRSLRFTETALEVFSLIAKLKDDGQTNDHIKRQLGEIVTEIIIPMPTNDGNYLMQMAEMYRALYEENQQMRQEFLEMEERIERRMMSADEQRERMEQRMVTQNENVSVILREMREIRQAQIAAAAEQEMATKKSIKHRLQEAWKAFKG